MNRVMAADHMSSNSSSPNGHSTMIRGNQIYKNVRNVNGLYRYEQEAIQVTPRQDD